MSFMAVMRNPSSGALFAIVGSDEQVVKEWKTHGAATRAMKKHFYAKAWGWQILEVEPRSEASAQQRSGDGK